MCCNPSFIFLPSATHFKIGNDGFSVNENGSENHNVEELKPIHIVWYPEPNMFYVVYIKKILPSICGIVFIYSGNPT